MPLPMTSAVPLLVLCTEPRVWPPTLNPLPTTERFAEHQAAGFRHMCPQSPMRSTGQEHWLAWRALGGVSGVLFSAPGFHAGTLCGQECRLEPANKREARWPSAVTTWIAAHAGVRGKEGASVAQRALVHVRSCKDVGIQRENDRERPTEHHHCTSKRAVLCAPSPVTQDRLRTQLPGAPILPTSTSRPACLPTLQPAARQHTCR